MYRVEVQREVEGVEVDASPANAKSRDGGRTASAACSQLACDVHASSKVRPCAMQYCVGATALFGHLAESSLTAA